MVSLVHYYNFVVVLYYCDFFVVMEHLLSIYGTLLSIYETSLLSLWYHTIKRIQAKNNTYIQIYNRKKWNIKNINME